jgi:hypothetical protein
MYLPTSFSFSAAIAGLSLFSLTAAAPTGTNDLVPRACTTALPAYVGWIDSAYPNQAFSHDDLFNIAHSLSPAYQRQALVRFDIPAGSTGCMLTQNFPPNFKAGDGQAQADVWGASGADFSFTWNNPPQKTTHWASTDYPGDQQLPVTAQGQSTVLMSNSCSTSIAFLFELSTWQQGAGSASFVDSATVGYQMVYNC